jgi:hypothetical protein
MSKKNNSEQSEKYLYLKETAKEYSEKHNTRLKEFLDEFEADEIDYIEREVEYFESTLYDVQNSESSDNGYAITGFDNFSYAYQLVMNIGYDKFMYSTNAKLKFLASQTVIETSIQNQQVKQIFTSDIKSTLTHYDKILKELQIIETIFYSQINPELHLGSGMGLPRYCNDIFIISDIELLKISDYKREYTSRLEQSNNTSLVVNELKIIHNKSVELYNYFIHNLHNHPNKKEFYVGKDAKQHIISSTGYYYFINYRVSFRFFEVEQDSEIMNTINSEFFKNGFKYNCKNETLVNFCEQLLDFINLSDILVENEKILKNNKTNKQNLFPKIFDCDNDRAYNLFKDFKNEIVTDFYLDYSFIFQKMQKPPENLIHKDCKHKYFMEWLFKEKHITQSVYEVFIDKASFSTKADKGNRSTRYYVIKNRYFPTDSD